MTREPGKLDLHATNCSAGFFNLATAALIVAALMFLMAVAR